MTQHTQFTIDEVSYQLSSDCEQALFPKLCDRVQKFIITHGKEPARHVFGPATAVGTTKLVNRVVRFKLTVNPQGIVL